MPSKTRVIVCGSSLYMASLAAGLGANPDLDVTRIPMSLAEAPDCLRASQANVIAVDLLELPIDLPMTLLRERPELLLLGMDPTSEELLVLSGHHADALSVADLVRIIAGRAPKDTTSTSASPKGGS
jgi:hypothetical protein